MKKKTFALLVLVLLALFYIGYNYIYQDHRDIASEKAAYKLQGKDIIKEFTENSNDAQIKYLNKTIEVKGIVTSVMKNTISLDSKIFCNMSDSLATYSKHINSSINIKGRFIGYDELLEELKLDQCTIIGNQF